MKKRILQLSLLLCAALLLTGCAMHTVEDMYALPKRSEEYGYLQSAIDHAMAGLSYSAPIAGENQQTVQMTDLDGDGIEEYLVFAAGEEDVPLQVIDLHQGDILRDREPLGKRDTHQERTHQTRAAREGDGVDLFEFYACLFQGGIHYGDDVLLMGT